MARCDADLVELARQGNTEAFGELYDRYARLVRAICADRTGDLTAAQDLTQDVFVRAFERMPELREPAHFGAWVVGIARYTSMEWLRRQQRNPRHVSADVAGEVDRAATESDDRLATLLSLLADLPEPERLALHAFYLEGHSAERGAAALGLSRSGFYKLLDSARRRLAQRYRQMQEDSVMNRDPSETELERCYGAFDERHATLLRELLATLAAKTPSPARADDRRTTPGRWLRPSLALAACLLIATFAWLTNPLNLQHKAYGLEDLPKRLLGVHSIYIHGTNYFPRRTAKGIETPATLVESYMERPNRYSNTSSDNPAEGVRQRRIASDGQRHIVIDDLARTVVEGKEAPLAAEYSVEDMIQNSLVQQLLGGPTVAGFRMVRSEPLAGMPADVYERAFQYPERQSRNRILVWLNPATGFPLQVQHFSRWADDPERLVSIYDKIEINAAPPARAFDFTPPPGYKVEHRDVTPDKVGSVMSGAVSIVDTGNQAFHALRFCFNIDDRAALVCWAQYNDLSEPRERDLDGPLGRPLKLTPNSSLGDRTYRNYFLRVDPGQVFHWRWSLVVPQGEHRTLSDGQLVFTVIEDDGILTRGTLFGTPLRFERERLAKWVVDAQRLTLPQNAPADAIFTLEQIEGLIEKFRTPKP